MSISAKAWRENCAGREKATLPCGDVFVPASKCQKRRAELRRLLLAEEESQAGASVAIPRPLEHRKGNPALEEVMEYRVKLLIVLIFERKRIIHHS